MDTDNKATNRACKIGEWLQTNIIKWSNIDEISCLLVELKFLQDTLPEQFRSALESEYHALSEWIKKKDTVSTLTELEKLQIYESGIDQKNFLKTIKTRHKYLKDLYLINFLASRSDLPKINSIRSFYFFLCLKMVELTDYDSRIETTLDECRFLTSNIREFLVPFLPDITEFESLNDLQSHLIESQDNDHYTRWLNSTPDTFESEIKKYGNKLLNKSTSFSSSNAKNELNGRIAKYLYEYILPIENYFKNDSGITRVTSTTYQVANGSLDYDDTTGNTISDLVNLTKCINSTEAFEDEERQDNEKESFEQVTVNTPSNYYLDLVRAEGQSNSRRKSAMNLVTSVNIAHEDDISTLVKYLGCKLKELDLGELDRGRCIDEKFKFDLSHQSALYLLMILLTGNENIFQSDNLEDGFNGYRYKLQFAPKRSYKDESWDKKLCANNESILFLYMPIVLIELHREMTYVLDDDLMISIHAQATNDIKAFNKKYKVRLSFNKIRNYFTSYLSQNGVDKALIEVITESPVHHLSALPYYNVSQYDLYRCQFKFTNHLLGLIDDKNIKDSKERIDVFFKITNEDTVPHFNDQKMGSLLAIREKLLTPIIEELKKNILEKIGKTSFLKLGDFVELHNFFTDYLYIWLSIASGYRPVNEPFGRLSDIDTRTGLYFISDKEVQQDTIGRFIYLPAILCQQIDEYIKFIKGNASLFNKLGNDIGLIYKNILDGNIGLICYLKLDEATSTVIRLKLDNAFLKKRISAYISLPLNWPRHYIRSLQNEHIGKYSCDPSLNEDSIGYDVVSAWMGHSDELGYSFYDRFSGLKRHELRAFAQTIDKLTKDIGFELIKLEH